MANTLADYFSGPVLSEMAQVEQIKTGLRWHLDPGFLVPSSTKIVGPEARWTAWKGTRKGAQLVGMNSPSVSIETPGEKTVTQSCLGSKENITVDIDMLTELASNIPYRQAQAQATFKRKVRAVLSRRETTRKNLAASALLTGQIAYKGNPQGQDGSQVTLPTTSGATVLNFQPITLNQGVNTFTVSNDDGTSNTYTITVPDFSSASTDIPGFFRTLNLTYEQVTGYQMQNMTYGGNFPSYIGVNNTQMSTYWSRNQKYGEQFLDSGEVPPGLFSAGTEGGTLQCRWHAGYMQWFQDPANNYAATQWLGVKQLVVTPEVDESWYEFMENGTTIPRGIGIASGTDIDAMTEQFTEVAYGSYGYAYPILDPYKLKVILGWNGLPVIKNGLVQWIINLAP